MKDLFKKSRQEQDMYAEILTQMGEHAVTLGVNPEHINVSNAWQKCDKTLRAYREAEQTVADLGYSSLPIALKALSQYKNKDKEYDISMLPEVFHKPSAIWLTGKHKTKNDKGFPPLRPRDAERQHKGVIPWLLEAWKLTLDVDNGESIRDEIVNSYLKTSPDEFERACYMYINDLEEPELEQQLSDFLSDPTYSEQLAAIRNASITKEDYNIGE